MLLRARPEAGAVNTWREAHFEPIGAEAEVVAAVRALFPAPLRWSRYDDSGWIFAQGDDAGRGVDLMFRAGPDGQVAYLVARKTDGPTLVKLVERFRLNYVFDPARAAYLDPYRVDAAGASTVADGVYELTPARRPPA